MKSAAAPEPHKLKFHWPSPIPHISLVLVGFLFLSVAIHGLAFYILQVVDPPVGVIPPPPAEVSLLTGATPENQALLRWIDAEDPAAFANPHEIVPGNLYDLQYERSSAEAPATPKSPEEQEAGVSFPPAVETMPAADSGQNAPTPVASTEAGSLPTELRFSGELAGRKIVKRPPLQFSMPGAANREPTCFMVGVGPDGKVLYTFLMGVEMDDNVRAMDRQAEECLQDLEFSRERDGVAWGMATFYWGNDTYQPAAKP